MKTPLRYPGGKSRAVPKLCQWLPAEITEYREPFLGGGSMAIEMTKRYPNLSIWVNDLYEPLIPPPTGDFGRDQIDLTELDPDDYIIWLEVDEKV